MKFFEKIYTNDSDKFSRTYYLSERNNLSKTETTKNLNFFQKKNIISNSTSKKLPPSIILRINNLTKNNSYEDLKYTKKQNK